ncbi:tetratricopeptide repeat protein, partial [Puniceibacterium sediminis]
DLGRREDALGAAEEAVALYRDLAAARPEAFTPNLAASLNTLANHLSALGRREEALAAAEEAVALYRDLVAARPEAFTPDLAGSLNNLANHLSDLGRREDALGAAEEAVALYRDLAAARPEAFTPDLAISLNNLAGFLSGLGRREDALEAAEEAVALRRDLAAARPEAFTPDLAMSLNNLAGFLSDLGRREAALEAAEEAVALRRDLAAARPEAFTPDLAASLNNLARFLSDLGRREAALGAAEEAVVLYRDLVGARPEAFTPNLAGSLNNLAKVLSALGRREAALGAAEEAVVLYRDLVGARPEAFTPNLAMSISVLSDMHRDLGDHARCRAACLEAAALLAPFMARHPDAHGGLFGQILKDYAAACAALGEEPDMGRLAPLLAEVGVTPVATGGRDPAAVEAALDQRLGALDMPVALPIMAPGFDWTHPDRGAALELLARLDLAAGDTPFTETHQVTGLRIARLPCCAGLVLADIAIASDPPAAATLLIGPAGVVGLYGTAQPLQALNTAGLIDMGDAEKAAAYLRLYCAAVGGDDGPFRIVDGIGDLALIDDTPETDRTRLSELIEPLQIAQDGDTWSGSGTACYGTTLFRVSFRLDRNGRVEMLDDTPLAADLSLHPVRYEGMFRFLNRADSKPEQDKS